ncbi:hypothetical protein BDW71DRAFT_213830 [Aspergillus fruticulosus]
MVPLVILSSEGITGGAIVHHLQKDASYKKIYALSRSDPGYKDPKLQHCAIDLQAELCRINGTMISNFIQALEKTGAINKLKRFILTCGFKQYSVHLGHAKQPFLEDDPVLEGEVGGETWPPNFYFTQQRILAEAATRSKDQWDWVVTLPQDVWATVLGLYCAICKAPPGSELPFPGCKAGYFAFNTWTSANLHAKFCLWAATAKGAAKNIFNVITVTRSPGRTSGHASPAVSAARSPTLSPVRRIWASPRTLEGGVPPTLFCQINPEQWAAREDVNKTWAQVRDKYGLDQKAWEKATWNFLTVGLGRDWSCVGTMSKARKLGWTGYADTWDELVDFFEALEKEGILPLIGRLMSDF